MLRLYVERSCQHSALSIQHSTLSFQRFAFDSIMQEMNRTVIRGTERYAELGEASWAERKRT